MMVSVALSQKNLLHVKFKFDYFLNFGIGPILFAPPVPPEFLVPLSDVTCDNGDGVTLRCKVCGRPRAAVTWRGPDQSNLTSNGHFSIAYR